MCIFHETIKVDCDRVVGGPNDEFSNRRGIIGKGASVIRPEPRLLHQVHAKCSASTTDVDPTHVKRPVRRAALPRADVWPNDIENLDDDVTLRRLLMILQEE